MRLPSALLRDLRAIVADAQRCTARDDAALERERPVFRRLLDSTEPMWPGTIKTNTRNVRHRWPDRKLETQQ